MYCRVPVNLGHVDVIQVQKYLFCCSSIIVIIVFFLNLNLTFKQFKNFNENRPLTKTSCLLHTVKNVKKYIESAHY